MIAVQCDECSKSYKVKSEMAGKKAKCKCGASIVIPKPRKRSPGKQSSAPARRKKPRPKPVESDPWDTDLDAEDYEADDDFVEDYEEMPRRQLPARRGARQGGKSAKGKGGSKKRRKRSAGSRFSTMQIVGMSFGGMALVGMLIGLLVKPIGLLAGGGVFIVCIALSVGGSLRCMIAAFEEDIMCGIMWMFVPFYSLYYIISRFSELAMYLMLWFGGLIGMFVAMAYLSVLGAM